MIFLVFIPKSAANFKWSYFVTHICDSSLNLAPESEMAPKLKYLESS